MLGDRRARGWACAPTQRRVSCHNTQCNALLLDIVDGRWYSDEAGGSKPVGDRMETMPDNDDLNFVIHKGWKNASDIASSAASDDVKADAIERALRKELRARGGMPLGEDLAAVIEEVRSGGVSPSSAFVEIDRITCRGRPGGLSMFGRDAAGAMVVRHAQGADPGRDAHIELMMRVCSGMVEHHVFGKLVHSQVCDAASYAGIQAGIERLGAQLHVRFAGVARQLVANPDGSAVTRFRAKAGARGTRALLRDSVLAPGPAVVSGGQS